MAAGGGDGAPISGKALKEVISHLHPREKLVLIALMKGLKDAEDIAERLGISLDAVIWALQLLKSKGLAEVEEQIEVKYNLGDEGRNYLEKCFPEVRLIAKVREAGGEATIKELKLEKDELTFGISWALKRKWIEIRRRDGERVIKLTEKGLKSLEKPYPPMQVLIKLDKGEALSSEDKQVLAELKRRGDIIREARIKHLKAKLTAIGAEVAKLIKPVEEVSELTRELIITGRWKKVYLRPYNVEVPTATPVRGKKHPYREIIDEIREVLIGLGFEEVSSPPIEVNFWNCDALFMPSDHPARGIHDIFYLKSKAQVSEVATPEVWERVKSTHESGWTTGSTGWGHWDPKLALRLILRSQTTAVSARYLSILKQEDLPKKIFTIDRNYRPDRIDSTHLPEFNQCEGIVVAENVNLRHLIGFIKAIAEAFGIEEVKFQPAYFPFTEPSVVGYIKHPKLGWIEALPGGIFRPEVVRPLGLNVPVLAWGLGIDRLAMVALDIDDIRMLFTHNLEWLRSKSIPSIWRW
ncbi:MAG: phenylalanine--tRNA ligase subunit alpha [Candidatus Methanomethylicota archaeon]|nr:phenylalanine--tRNA ligase subunit alpha [Candidatus Culexmicrobium cathedralense]RLE48658.1 MAG: phenylalanine--tRNA ligase subunit alpha [Candidatus Verstraetearchaeota archaeon]